MASKKHYIDIDLNGNAITNAGELEVIGTSSLSNEGDSTVLEIANAGLASAVEVTDASTASPAVLFNKIGSHGVVLEVTTNDDNSNIIEVNANTTTTAYVLDLSKLDAITTGRVINLVTNSPVYSGSDGLLRIKIDNPSATGVAQNLTNDGSGTGLYVEQNGVLASGKAAVDFWWRSDNTTSGMPAFLYVHSAVAHTGAKGRALSKFENTNTSSTATPVYITQKGTSEAVFIDMDNNNRAIFIDHDDSGSTSSIEIDRDGNTSSTIVGLKVDVENVGSGAKVAVDATSGLVRSRDGIEVTDATKGVILKSPDGTRYRVTVANGGTLSVTAA